MSQKNLKRKPLLEAILEIRWVVEEQKSPVPTLPDYRISLAEFFARVSKEYPFYEALPTASFPEDMLKHNVQYRFRRREGGWPLLQVGPGIATLNDTEAYSWSDYEQRAMWLARNLFEAYPKISLESLMLRYINAVEVDFSKESILDFLRDKFKVKVELPETLFQNGRAESLPNVFLMQSAFNVKDPAGTIQIQFGKGRARDRDAVIWESVVKSPNVSPEGFAAWLNAAHDVIEDWFFKLVEGELLRGFE